MLPLLIVLGLWQLDRAAEKRAYQDRYFDRVGELPHDPPASLAGAGFERLRLRGAYREDRDYLVDNKVHDGIPGYWVVSRFAAADGRVYLINRGWVAAPAHRDRLPAIATPPGAQTLVVVVWPDMGLPPLLAGDSWGSAWPKRVQRLDVTRMAADADSPGERVVAAELRLEPGQPGALVAAPVDLEFRPERHQAYALQWFALAMVLVAGYGVYGRRQARGRT